MHKVSIQIFNLLIGCFITFNAMAQISTKEQTIVEQVAKATEKERKKQENMELDLLPDVINCKNSHWMKNCKLINRYAKKHPDAPLRVIAKNGKEVVIQPGAPSALTKLILDPTPQNASDMVDFISDLNERSKKSGLAYRDNMFARGGISGIPTLSESREKLQKANADISTEFISLQTFVNSTCGYCKRQIKTLAKLKKLYPNLKINIYQLDNNPVALRQSLLGTELTGRVLTQAEVQSAQKNGITQWPITWISRKDIKKRRQIIGVQNISLFENNMLAMSKLELFEAK